MSPFGFYNISWLSPHQTLEKTCCNAVMKRFFLLFVSSLALAAQAGFVAQPYGDQIVADDGSVTLPQGGLIKDNKHGISIDAKYIEYKDNVYLRAKTAKLKNGTGQTLFSPNINYMIANDRMEIAGALTYSDENVTGLNASRAVAYPDAKRIVAWNISAGNPSIKADAAVFDDSNNQVFLYGNYFYKSTDGKTSKQRNGATAMLLVNFSNQNRTVYQEGSQIPSAVAKSYTDLIARK
jgi:hypothetical protein